MTEHAPGHEQQPVNPEVTFDIKHPVVVGEIAKNVNVLDPSVDVETAQQAVERAYNPVVDEETAKRRAEARDLAIVRRDAIINADPTAREERNAQLRRKVAASRAPRLERDKQYLQEDLYPTPLHVWFGRRMGHQMRVNSGGYVEVVRPSWLATIKGKRGEDRLHSVAKTQFGETFMNRSYVAHGAAEMGNAMIRAGYAVAKKVKSYFTSDKPTNGRRFRDRAKDFLQQNVEELKEDYDALVASHLRNFANDWREANEEVRERKAFRRAARAERFTMLKHRLIAAMTGPQLRDEYGGLTNGLSTTKRLVQTAGEKISKLTGDIRKRQQDASKPSPDTAMTPFFFNEKSSTEPDSVVSYVVAKEDAPLHVYDPTTQPESVTTYVIDQETYEKQSRRAALRSRIGSLSMAGAGLYAAGMAFMASGKNAVSRRTDDMTESERSTQNKNRLLWGGTVAIIAAAVLSKYVSIDHMLLGASTGGSAGGGRLPSTIEGQTMTPPFGDTPSAPTVPNAPSVPDVVKGIPPKVTPPQEIVPGTKLSVFEQQVTVEQGNGYAQELQDLLGQRNVDLSGAEAWRLYEHLNDTFPNMQGNYFTDNNSYQIAPGEYGISRSGQSTWDPRVLEEIERFTKKKRSTT